MHPSAGIDWVNDQLTAAGGINDQIQDVLAELDSYGDNLDAAGLSDYGVLVDQVLAGSLLPGQALSSLDSAINASGFSGVPRDFATVESSMSGSEASINSILNDQLPGYEQQLRDADPTVSARSDDFRLDHEFQLLNGQI